jgi:hypothetical protein
MTFKIVMDESNNTEETRSKRMLVTYVYVSPDLKHLFEEPKPIDIKFTLPDTKQEFIKDENDISCFKGDIND